MAANDHSVIRTAVRQDEAHDYAASMAFAQDERNWFLRARGEWDEEKRQPKENDMTAMEHFRDNDPEPDVCVEMLAAMTSLYHEVVALNEKLAANLAHLERAYNVVVEHHPDPQTLMELWREGKI